MLQVRFVFLFCAEEDGRAGTGHGSHHLQRRPTAGSAVKRQQVAEGARLKHILGAVGHYERGSWPYY